MANAIWAYNGAEKACGLNNNARIARKVGASVLAGGAWTKLRVATFLSPEVKAGNISTIFEMGLCSGTTNIPGDATCTNAIGVRHNGTWSNDTWRYSNMYGEAYKTVNSVGTQIYGFSNWWQVYTGEGVTTHGMMLFVDITKGSPNFSMNFFMPGAPGTPVPLVGVDYPNCLYQNPPVFTNQIYDVNRTGAFSESNGTLDSVYVRWTASSHKLAVRDLRVIRLA